MYTLMGKIAEFNNFVIEKSRKNINFIYGLKDVLLQNKRLKVL